MYIQVCQTVSRNTKVEAYAKHLALYAKVGFDTHLYKATGRYPSHLQTHTCARTSNLYYTRVERILDHEDIVIERMKEWGMENIKLFCGLR
jgi:predicted glycoside hydrolase/deacetylase ChbG (UPF0249 family)